MHMCWLTHQKTCSLPPFHAHTCVLNVLYASSHACAPSLLDGHTHAYI